MFKRIYNWFFRSINSSDSQSRVVFDWMCKSIDPALPSDQSGVSSKLQPIILSADNSDNRKYRSTPTKITPVQYDLNEVQNNELTMNVAMRAILNVMAIEGLISKAQANEFIDTHAVVVACKARGMSGILHSLGLSDNDVKANFNRVTVVRLPVPDHYKNSD